MQDKIPILIVYGMLGLLLGAAPLFMSPDFRAAGTGPADRPLVWRGSTWLAICCIAITAIWLLYARPSESVDLWTLLFGMTALAGIMQRNSLDAALQASAASFLGCAVCMTLPWWRRHGGGVIIADDQILTLAPLWIIGAWVLVSNRLHARAGRIEGSLTFGLYCVVAAYFSFSLTSLADPAVFVVLWHHWGAYIGPSELVLAGARLFQDIPAQYGAGPTFLLSTTCGGDCWTAAYWVFGLTSFAYAVAIGALAWGLRTGDRWRDLLLLVICCLACTFWIASPSATSAALVTPSTGGMRFLPVIVLALWIVSAGRLGTRTRIWGECMLWVFGFLWSPESAFYVSLTWWPVYLFDHRGRGPLVLRFRAILLAAGQLLALAIGTLIAAALVYRLGYGVFPMPLYLLTYVLYPPGPLPIDWHGDIWFFLFALALSIGVSWTSWIGRRDPSRFRHSLTLQLMAFSVFSYYIGRSHDNNILNLMPFLVLILADSLSYPTQYFPRYAAAMSLASTLAWTTVFGWQPWRDGLAIGNLAAFDFATTRKKLTYDNARTARRLAYIGGLPVGQFKQVSQLMDDLHQRGEPFTVLSLDYCLQPRYSDLAWNAIHGPANFFYVPSSLRREFLQHTAQRIRRTGWVIVDRKFDADPWLADYDAVYRRTDRIDLDNYYAIRYAVQSSAE